MRQDVLDYVSGLNLGGFVLSQELPWEESGTALYLKNLKKVYIDATEIQNEPLIQTLSGLNINNEISIVRIYFSCDAKQLPANYDDVVSDLVTAKNIQTDVGYTNRQAGVTTEIVNDIISTTVELRFTKLST